ncbi:hypothetical protein OAK03_03280 [Gammaproteobacteria bacterium]|nr:hypothetical protein [Gammaproteobacteria bacterium]
MSKNKEKQIEELQDHKMTTISKPLSEMEVVDLMIYGDDVLLSNEDNKHILTNK